MYFQEFSEFGDGAQLWIYPFRDPINEDEASLVKKTLGQFLQTGFLMESQLKESFGFMRITLYC